MFKLINKDITVIIIMKKNKTCYFSAAVIIFRHDITLHLINGVTYIYAKIQSTTLHLFELLSRQFPGDFPKSQINYFSKTSLDAYFKLTSDISLKSARFKNQKRQPWCKTLENMIFLYYSNNFNKNWRREGWGKGDGGGAGCFIL